MTKTDEESPSAASRVNDAILNFLATDIPSVLCIRGPWGVGKTYNWTETLREANKAGKVALKHYSYVSLFGLDSLDAFKYTIFENMVGIANGSIDPPTMETASKNLIEAGKRLGRKAAAPIIQNIPFLKSTTAVTQMFSFLAVSKVIVCIDDVERRGKNLPLKDVLGLVSYLAEKRSCKVVVILNDKEFPDEADVITLNAFQEKVMDTSLLYAPSSHDAVKIAIKTDAPLKAYMAERCVALEITNIRIIKKIERFVDSALPALRAFEDEVSRDVVKSIVLFAWAHLAQVRDGSYTLIQHVLDEKKDRMHFAPSRQEVPAERQRWAELLERYGHIHTTALDELIISAVQSGFFDQEDLHQLAENADAHEKAKKGAALIDEAWRKFEFTFSGDSQELMNRVIFAVYPNIYYVSLQKFNDIIRALRALGRNDASDKLIAHYMKEVSHNYTFYDMSDRVLAPRDFDPVLMAEFEKRYDELKPQRATPLGAGLALGENGGYSPEHIDVLHDLGVDGLEKLFLELEGNNHLIVIRGILDFSRVQTDNKKVPELVDFARMALRRIAKTSAANAWRVSMFIGPEPQPEAVIEASATAAAEALSH